MTRPRRRRPQAQAAPDSIRSFVDQTYAIRQMEWAEELAKDSPDWVSLLGMHLQMTELENLAAALEEFA